MARLVALAPEGYWRQIGAIRLDEDTIQRRPRGHLGQFGVLGKGQRPGEREIHPQVERVARYRNIADEAMEHTAQAHTVRAKQADHVGVRLTIVQDDRQIEFARQPKLRDERPALYITRGKIAIIIEANLTNRDDAWLARQRVLLRQRFVR